MLTLVFVSAAVRMHCFEEHEYGFVVKFEGNLKLVSFYPSVLRALPTRSLLHEGHWLIGAN